MKVCPNAASVPRCAPVAVNTPRTALALHGFVDVDKSSIGTGQFSDQRIPGLLVQTL